MLTHTCYYVLGSLITFLLPILSFLWGFQSDRPDTRPVRLSDWFETSCYEPLLAVAEKITKNAKLTPQLPYESVCWSYFYLPDIVTAFCYLSLCYKIVDELFESSDSTVISLILNNHDHMLHPAYFSS